MTSAGVMIRAASREDGAAIAAVHVRSWQVAYRGQLPDELLDNLSVAQRTIWWGEDWWNQDPARQALLVAQTGDAIAGFASVGPNRDDDASDRIGELYAIYADPDAWGHGVGRRLMERAVEELRSVGFTEATLWVLESNERARRFYGMAGWEPDGRRRVEQLPLGAEAVEIRYHRAL